MLWIEHVCVAVNFLLLMKKMWRLTGIRCNLWYTIYIFPATKTPQDNRTTRSSSTKPTPFAFPFYTKFQSAWLHSLAVAIGCYCHCQTKQPSSIFFLLNFENVQRNEWTHCLTAHFVNKTSIQYVPNKYYLHLFSLHKFDLFKWTPLVVEKGVQRQICY